MRSICRATASGSSAPFTTTVGPRFANSARSNARSFASGSTHSAHASPIIANVGPDATDGVAKVEVFDKSGTLRGTAPFPLLGRGNFIATTIVDVVNAVGAGPDLDLGQVRVTRTSGAGVLWGALATVFDAGIQVSVGENP